MNRKFSRYRVSFVVAGKERTIDIESYGVLDACREIKSMFPTAQVTDVVRI